MIVAVAVADVVVVIVVAILVVAIVDTVPSVVVVAVAVAVVDAVVVVVVVVFICITMRSIELIPTNVGNLNLFRFPGKGGRVKQNSFRNFGFEIIFYKNFAGGGGESR